MKISPRCFHKTSTKTTKNQVNSIKVAEVALIYLNGKKKVLIFLLTFADVYPPIRPQ